MVMPVSFDGDLFSWLLIDVFYHMSSY